MAAFGSLATELLDQICRHVYNPADMLCFSLVDRRFHSTIRSALKQAKAWHRLYVSAMDYESESSISETPDYVDPVRAILRNIIHLSERHRYWVLHYVESPNVPLACFRGLYKSTLEAFNIDPNARSIITNDIKLFTDAAKTAGLSRVEDLVTGLANSNPDAHLGLLLSLCPNLRSISLRRGRKILLLEKCWDYAADHPQTTSSFQYLHDVSCQHQDTEFGFEFRSLFPLFRLPSLRSINAHMALNYHHEENVIFMGQTKTSGITDITLTQSGLDLDTLSLVLRWPKTLKRLYLEEADDSEGGVDFSPTKLAEDLASQERSLEVLEIPNHAGIMISNSTLVSEGDDPNRFTIGSLREFTSLRILDVHLGLLLGEKYETFVRYGYKQGCRSTHRLVDLLPRSLQELTLRGPDSTDDSDKHICELARHTEARLPALRSFVLRPYKYCKRTPEELTLFDEYKAMFANVNVSFMVQMILT